MSMNREETYAYTLQCLHVQVISYERTPLPPRLAHHQINGTSPPYSPDFPPHSPDLPPHSPDLPLTPLPSPLTPLPFFPLTLVLMMEIH